MMRGAMLLVVALLAGCGQAAEAPDTAPTETLSPAPQSLVGEYRVAGIDGAELNTDFGIALSIDQGHVSFEPTCAGFVWQYAYRDGVLDIERRQEKLHHPPPPVCAIAIHPMQAKLAEALEAVDRAEITPVNGIELSGNGRSVLLFSQ